MQCFREFFFAPAFPFVLVTRGFWVKDTFRMGIMRRMAFAGVCVVRLFRRVREYCSVISASISGPRQSTSARLGNSHWFLYQILHGLRFCVTRTKGLDLESCAGRKGKKMLGYGCLRLACRPLQRGPRWLRIMTSEYIGIVLHPEANGEWCLCRSKV